MNYYVVRLKLTQYCKSTILQKKIKTGTSVAVQWLRLCASTAGGMGSIPGRGTKIPHATR